MSARPSREGARKRLRRRQLLKMNQINVLLLKLWIPRFIEQMCPDLTAFPISSDYSSASNNSHFSIVDTDNYIKCHCRSVDILLARFAATLRLNGY